MNTRHCPKCGRTGSSELPYCPAHGVIMIEPEPYEVHPPYDKTHGLWEVTTEGDCEGRTTVNLGTYRGHIDEIARHLAGSAMYSLHFRISEICEHWDTRDDVLSVNVTLDIHSGTWDHKPDERAEIVEKMFKENGRPVTITPGRYYASFNINYPEKEE